MQQNNDNLTDKIARAKEKLENPYGKKNAAVNNAGMAIGMRMAIELLSAVAVGLVLGYFLDKWLHTKPIFMMILVLLGFVAGIFNIIRTAQELEKNKKNTPLP
ncbi:MAG: AtpZ/AtpI family protein [Alphaproteobacteria bacterium]